jgi:hypothetical protein
MPEKGWIGDAMMLHHLLEGASSKIGVSSN